MVLLASLIQVAASLLSLMLLEQQMTGRCRRSHRPALRIEGILDLGKLVHDLLGLL